MLGMGSNLHFIIPGQSVPAVITGYFYTSVKLVNWASCALLQFSNQSEFFNYCFTSWKWKLLHESERTAHFATLLLVSLQIVI